MIALFFESMYIGVIRALVMDNEAYLLVGIAFLASTLLALLTAGIAYYLGSIGKGVISRKTQSKN